MFPTRPSRQFNPRQPQFDFDFVFTFIPPKQPSPSIPPQRIVVQLINTRLEMDEDPINHFFTPSEVEDPKILYSTLALTSTATAEEIRKSYRRQALRLHPDKQSNKSEKEKEELGKAFQKVGFAYAVLSDEAKRKRCVCLISYCIKAE